MDFKSESFGSSIGTLPVDPINQTSSGLYYAYVANGDPWELTSNMESGKYGMGGSNDVVTKDGGQYPDLYEVGTDLSLAPVDYDPSLVGYWKLDEGSGSTAYDSSGHGNDGTWSGTEAGTSGYYSAGHNQSWAGMFDGSSTATRVSVALLTAPPSFSVCAWAYVNAFGSWTRMVDANWDSWFALDMTSGGAFYWQVKGTNIASGVEPLDTWYLVCGTYDGANSQLYVNGSQAATGSPASPVGATENVYIGADSASGDNWNGLIQDVRLYNRALSASEIEAIYNAEK